jgi:hypothetical protein
MPTLNTNLSSQWQWRGEVAWINKNMSPKDLEIPTIQAASKPENHLLLKLNDLLAIFLYKLHTIHNRNLHNTISKKMLSHLNIICNKLGIIIYKIHHFTFHHSKKRTFPPSPQNQPLLTVVSSINLFIYSNIS